MLKISILDVSQETVIIDTTVHFLRVHCLVFVLPERMMIFRTKEITINHWLGQKTIFSSSMDGMEKKFL